MPRINGDAGTRRHSARPRGLLTPEIALGRPVTKQRAHAELLAHTGENGERSLDQIWRFVMIDE